MKIAIPKERRTGETRVAGSPDLVKKLVGFGFEVVVEKGAGASAYFTDSDFKDAGATIAGDARTTLAEADVILKIRAPLIDENPEKSEITLFKPGAMVIGQMAALTNRDAMETMAKANLTVFALELMPRISRAQSMDILSSQNNLAGYKAVIDAAAEFGSAFPMMMTAAGTVPPAKVFIMGVGVAGLQAIATARRLGAVVTGYDVRPATKEQVESLGAKFVMVDESAMKDAETSGGYAKEMSEEYRKKQEQVVAEHIRKQDIVITTALIPGRRAPILVTEDMVKSMRTGAVIIDLAAEAGGNCALTQPGKVATRHGVRIVGHENVPGRLPRDASSLFARNLLNFLSPHVDKANRTLNFKWDDEIVAGTLVSRDGRLVHPMLTGEGK